MLLTQTNSMQIFYFSAWDIANTIALRPPTTAGYEVFTGLFASTVTLTCCPLKSGTSLVNIPLASTGQGSLPPFCRIPLAKHTR